jgi:hypothetical protein
VITTPTPAALCATLIREVGDLWFSTAPEDRAEAKRHCRRCPVREACAQAGLDLGDNARGVWGGLGSGDRRTLRKSQNGAPATDTTTPPTRRPCGNNPAYMAHRRLGETCDICEAAHNAWVEARRREALARHHAAGGTSAGRKLHRLLGESPCDACQAAARADKAASRARVNAAKRAHEARHTAPTDLPVAA